MGFPIDDDEALMYLERVLDLVTSFDEEFDKGNTSRALDLLREANDELRSFEDALNEPTNYLISDEVRTAVPKENPDFPLSKYW